MPVLGQSTSSASLAPPKFIPGQVRITDQVIEEVDEQLTVQSTRGPEKRPTAQSIFKHLDDKPVRSAPIDVPGSFHNNEKIQYDRVQSVMSPEHLPYVFQCNEVFSTSAPEAPDFTHLRTPTINVDNVDDPSPKLSEKDGEYCLLLFFFLIVKEDLKFSDFFFSHGRGRCGCYYTNNNTG